MKTKILNIVLLALVLTTGQLFAQDVTTVRANTPDISDNLDLKAVASIFGDSRDLEDFERRLNDPNLQISNLDLNGDGRVDYLRVVESSENSTHLIILQAVLAQDVFQDVATIEVERDRSNNVTIQVVGDTYIYGSNYIYEPVYVVRPPMFSLFWVSSYRPYYSPWYWGYYPSYYTYWAPYPVYRYRNNVHTHINTRNNYVYVNTRRSTRAVAMYNTRRQDGYERQNPNNSFASRNNNVSNRYALEQSRGASRTASAGSRVSPNINSRNTSLNTANRSNGTAPIRATNLSNSSDSGMRSADTPARNSNSAVRSNPSLQTETRVQQPVRVQSNNGNGAFDQRATSPSLNNTPSRSSNNNMRSNTPAPAMQQSAPARPANNSMHSTPVQQPQRQSAPAASPSRATPSGASRQSRG